MFTECPHLNYKIELMRDGSIMEGVHVMERCKCFIIFFSKSKEYSGIKLTNFKWLGKKRTHCRSQGPLQVLKCWNFVNCFCNICFHFSNMWKWSKSGFFIGYPWSSWDENPPAFDRILLVISYPLKFQEPEIYTQESVISYYLFFSCKSFLLHKRSKHQCLILNCSEKLWL